MLEENLKKSDAGPGRLDDKQNQRMETDTIRTLVEEVVLEQTAGRQRKEELLLALGKLQGPGAQAALREMEGDVGGGGAQEALEGQLGC